MSGEVALEHQRQEEKQDEADGQVLLSTTTTAKRYEMDVTKPSIFYGMFPTLCVTSLIVDIITMVWLYLNHNDFETDSWTSSWLFVTVWLGLFTNLILLLDWCLRWRVPSRPNTICRYCKDGCIVLLNIGTIVLSIVSTISYIPSNPFFLLLPFTHVAVGGLTHFRLIVGPGCCGYSND